MTRVTLSLIAFTSASFFYIFFFREKWIYIRCFLTCRENSIMPPFIIAAFRSSGLFEVLSGSKLTEHLTFLLCRHTSQSVAPLHPHTCCIIRHCLENDVPVYQSNLPLHSKSQSEQMRSCKMWAQVCGWGQSGTWQSDCSIYIHRICMIRNMVYPEDTIKRILKSICHLISTCCLELRTTALLVIHRGLGNMSCVS